MCPKCLETRHVLCRVCTETEQTPRGILGEMKKSTLHLSLLGHNKDGVIKITYRIPDGIQGEGHPSPGKPFRGGTFEAFLPDTEKAKKLLPRLERAFRGGLTFTVRGKGSEAQVTWDCIPHKTSLQGGKAQKGYPDSNYLTRLSDVLNSHGID
ncbi:E3 ubiquitin-protein ligase DTX3L [Nematolebias whitei]|uniref:E3 ubiquitin-protein ligase DTX3L n=1 Tax=Nematolebias whitei TaxID=451745 RepID=UPI00189984BF|nr:E3 ubiquitin-protein ligase DTX3L [Nematolebias whitei]